MINLPSTISGFDEIIHDPPKMPVDFQAGNVFLPPKSFVLESTATRKDKVDFSVSLQSKTGKNLKDRDSDVDRIQRFFDNQIKFSNVALRRLPSNANILNNCGLSYLNQGDLTTAEEYFCKALKIRKDFFPAMQHLAKIHLLRGDNRKALEIYSKLREIRPTDPKVLLNAAQIHVGQMELDKATVLLTEVLEHKPDDPSALNNLGVISLLQRNFSKAIHLFRKALESNVRFASVQNNLGVAYVLARNLPKAERSFDTVLTLDRDNTDAIRNLSALYFKTSQHEKAIRLLEDYLDRRTTDVTSRNLLALHYLELKDYTRSNRQLSLAVKQAREQRVNDASIAKFLNNLGVVCHRSGNFHEAKKYYSEALNTAQPDKTTVYNLISLLLHYNVLGEAKEMIEKCLASHPNDAVATEFLGRYSALAGLYEEAITYAAKAAEMSPTSASPYTLWGSVLIEAFNDCDQAIKVTRDGLVKNPTDKGLLNNLAYALLMKDDVTSARATLDRVDKSERNVFLTATQGLLLLKEHDLEGGMRLYNEAARLAETQELRNQVIQKKHLELAKIALRENRLNDARKLLTKVLGSKTQFALFKWQAHRLIEITRQNVL